MRLNNELEIIDSGHFQVDSENTETLKPGFHLQQTPRQRLKKQSDSVVEQSSFALIALSWLKIGRCRGRN